MLQAPWLFAAALAAHVLGDAAGTLDLSDRLEVRGRNTQFSAGPIIPNPSLDLVDTATARLGLVAPRWAYTFGASTVAMLPDIEAFVTPMVIQSGDAGVTWHDREVTIGLAEYGAYGLINSIATGPLVAPTSGAAPPPATVQLLSQPGNVYYLSSRSVLTATDRVSRRWTLALTTEYAVQGGLDAPSRLVMPFVRGPRAEVTATYALSRRDDLETSVMAQRSDTSEGYCSPYIAPSYLPQPGQLCAPVGQVGQFTEGLRHALSNEAHLSAAVGVAGAQVRFQDVQSQFDNAVFPVATAGLEWSRRGEGEPRTLRLDFAAAPFIDLRSGIVDERAQVTGSLHIPMRDLVYSGTLGATRSIASPFVLPMTSFQSDAEVEYLVSKVVGVGGGVRYLWQDQVGLGTLSLAIVFAQVTFRTAHLRF